jgi:hypothetical protein
MTASPWAPPQNGGQQSAPVLPPPQATSAHPQTGPPPAGPPLPPVAPPPRPPRRGLPWLLIGGAVVLLIAAIAATAAITYAVARNTNAPTAAPPPAAPTPQAPQFTTGEQDAAKQQLCQVFDTSTKGLQGQGGVRINGDANLPLMLRSLNSAVAVQNALMPATPRDVSDAARRYIDANLNLTTAATGTTPIEEVNRLNALANTATFALADACGLPH